MSSENFPSHTDTTVGQGLDQLISMSQDIHRKMKDVTDSVMDQRLARFEQMVKFQESRIEARHNLLLEKAAEQYQFQMKYIEQIRRTQEKVKAAQSCLENLKGMSNWCKLESQNYKDIKRTKEDCNALNTQEIKKLEDEFSQTIKPRKEKVLAEEFNGMVEKNGVKMQIEDGKVEINLQGEQFVIGFSEEIERWELVSGSPAAHQIIEEFNIHNNLQLLFEGLRYLTDPQNGGTIYF